MGCKIAGHFHASRQGATVDIAVAAGLPHRGAAASSRVVASSEDEVPAELPDRVG